MNLDGQVIGVNARLPPAATTAANAAWVFAIPVNVVAGWPRS
jgi:hypothetical protein